MRLHSGALEQQLQLAEERIERAEAESAYFAEMLQAVAKQGKVDDHTLADIRAKVRATLHEADVAQPDD